ncbi:MAG: ABC transporter permease, partial [Chloroflexi bacterium]|nr:ABC transporter permease [Chloroflexota bacterium]
AVVDQDRSALSRQLIAALENTGDLDLRYYLTDVAALQKLLDTGQARVGLVIPPHFERDVQRPGTSTAVQVIVDGSSVIVGATAVAVPEGVIADFTRRALAPIHYDQSDVSGLAGLGGQSAGIDLRVNVLFNPTLNARIYTIPAQLGFIVFQIALLIAALGFARERELGTFEQLQVSPLTKLELILGKAIPAMVMGLANFLILYVVTITVLGVPMRGSFWTLLGLTFVFLAADVAMGLVISALSGSQQQAMLFVFLFAILEVNLSGYLVSTKNMPTFLQALAELTPLQHYLTVVRDVMLKGSTLEMLAWNAGALVVLAVALGAVAWLLLQRRLA